MKYLRNIRLTPTVIFLTWFCVLPVYAFVVKDSLSIPMLNVNGPASFLQLFTILILSSFGMKGWVLYITLTAVPSVLYFVVKKVLWLPLLSSKETGSKMMFRARYTRALLVLVALSLVFQYFIGQGGWSLWHGLFSSIVILAIPFIYCARMPCSNFQQILAIFVTHWMYFYAFPLPPSALP